MQAVNDLLHRLFDRGNIRYLVHTYTIINYYIGICIITFFNKHVDF
jgi:hypothetical protein